MNHKDRLTPVLFCTELFLWTIKSIAYLLYNLFAVSYPGTRFIQADELEIEPGIRLAEVGIYIFDR